MPHLDDCSLSINFQHLTFSSGSVAKLYVHNLSVSIFSIKIRKKLLREFNILQNDQWTVDIKNSTVIDSWSDVIVAHCCICVDLEG